jgi:Arc/MetJ-type ribon-helix-helix transcriptional regulator
MQNDRISVRLDDETQRRLRAEVRATGKNESDLVREALTDYFRRRPEPESCLELARQAGIIGCGKRLPSDLSTNKDHFEGFGR